MHKYLKTLKSRIFVCPSIAYFRSKALGPSLLAPWHRASEYRRYAPRAAEWANASGKKYPHARSCSRSGGSRTTMCFKRCADGWRISTTRQRVANQPMPDRSAQRVDIEVDLLLRKSNHYSTGPTYTYSMRLHMLSAIWRHWAQRTLHLAQQNWASYL